VTAQRTLVVHAGRSQVGERGNACTVETWGSGPVRRRREAAARSPGRRPL